MILLLFISSHFINFNHNYVIHRFRYTSRFSFDINVPAKSRVTFNLTYQELLQRVNGRYQHKIYVDPGQIVEDLTVDIVISESRNITKLLVPRLRNNTLSNKDGLYAYKFLIILLSVIRKNVEILRS